jgi:flavorubredoxin
MNGTAPQDAPHRIAEDTWLIPNLVPTAPDTYLGVNGMLIRGEQPVIVDTGAPVHRESWLEKVFSLVDPEDVRWIYLSHDDGDHTGGLQDALAMCPNATLVGNFFLTERLALEQPMPLERMVWLGPDERLDVGDRTLRLIVPPIFDGPTTRALFDERSGVLWAVDSFAALNAGAGFERGDTPDEVYDETFALFNSMISPWHQWLDPVAYQRHIGRVQGLGASAVASAHGPVLRGDDIADAFARVGTLAGRPIAVPPGQELLDELVAAALAETALVPVS